MALRYGCGVPLCKLCEEEAIDMAQRLSSCTVNSTSMSHSSGASNQVATSTSTSAAASEQEVLTAMQARHLCVSQVTEITQRNSSDTAIDTSSSPSSAFSSQVAASTSTYPPASVQMYLREIQANHLSLSQRLLPQDFPHQNMSSCNVSSISQTTQARDIAQHISSCTVYCTSSSPSSSVSSQVATSTSTSAAAREQEAVTAMQARHLSLSQAQQAVSHAAQQFQQVQIQHLQQQQQQINHHHRHHSNHSHQNALIQHHNSINHDHSQIPTMPSSASHPHNIKTVQPQISEPSPEETTALEELKQFAKTFKQRRIKMGFSQGEVSRVMGELYGNELSDKMISRFEALELSNLSFKTMCKIKPFLQKWLEDAESSLTNPRSLTNPMTTPKAIGKRRKYSRTSIETSVRVALESTFLQNPYPTPEERAKLAESLGMEKEVVRVWFCNRRRKEKSINLPSAAMGSPTIIESAPNMFASNVNSPARGSLPSPSSLVSETGGHSSNSGIKKE